MKPRSTHSLETTCSAQKSFNRPTPLLDHCKALGERERERERKRVGGREVQRERERDRESARARGRQKRTIIDREVIDDRKKDEHVHPNACAMEKCKSLNFSLGNWSSLP